MGQRHDGGPSPCRLMGDRDSYKVVAVVRFYSRGPCARSSSGERFLDTEEVLGSTPSARTNPFSFGVPYAL